MKTRMFTVVVLLFVIIFSAIPHAAAQGKPEFLIYRDLSNYLHAYNVNTGDSIEIGNPFSWEIKNTTIAAIFNIGELKFINLLNGKEDTVKEPAVEIALSPDKNFYAYLLPTPDNGWEIKGKLKGRSSIKFCVPYGCAVENMQTSSFGTYILVSTSNDKADRLAQINDDGTLTYITSDDENVLDYRLMEDPQRILAVTATTEPHTDYRGVLTVLKPDGSFVFSIDAANPDIDPQIAVYGSQFVYVREHNLYLQDLADPTQWNTYTQLTADGTGWYSFPMFSTEGNYLSYLKADSEDGIRKPYYMVITGGELLPIPLER